MLTRRAVAPAATAVLALALAACEPSDSDSASPAPAPTTSVQPTTAADRPTAARSATASDPGETAGSTAKCQGATSFPAGTRMVNLSRPATATALYAKDTTASCSMNGAWIWRSTGSEKTYRVAATAHFALNTKGIAQPETVTRDQFLAHTQKCETGQQDDFSMCMRQPGEATYKITVDSSGAVTDISEVFYS